MPSSSIGGATVASAEATTQTCGAPQNLEAEKSVLGAMLVASTATEPVIANVGLSASDFYREQHRIIFRAIASLHEKKESVDSLTTSEHLNQKGELNEAGGRDYVHSLASTVPAASNALHYAKIVRDNAILRRKHTAAQEIQSAIERGDSERLKSAEAELSDASKESKQQAGAGWRDDPRAVDGARFILDAPEHVPAVWGTGAEVLHAEREPLLIVGPAGVGKTTLAGQYALRRHGAHDGDLLGLPVAVDPRKILYMALDRPSQIARSFRRMVTEKDRNALEWLHTWAGPIPFDVTTDPLALTHFVKSFPNVGTVVIDSLKDLAAELSRDEVGSKINLAVQQLVGAGVEVVTLHHQRKAQGENRRPNKLADVFGSTWLTAGAGSVVLLWGDPGDPIVELHHLKQPAAEVGPLTLFHDHERGVTSLHETVDLYELVQEATNGGLAVVEAAQHMYGSGDPDRNQVEKARRKLTDLVSRGHAVKVEGSTPKSPALYRPAARA